VGISGLETYVLSKTQSIGLWKSAYDECDNDIARINTMNGMITAFRETFNNMDDYWNDFKTYKDNSFVRETHFGRGYVYYIVWQDGTRTEVGVDGNQLYNGPVERKAIARHDEMFQNMFADWWTRDIDDFYLQVRQIHYLFEANDNEGTLSDMITNTPQITSSITNRQDELCVDRFKKCPIAAATYCDTESEFMKIACTRSCNYCPSILELSGPGVRIKENNALADIMKDRPSQLLGMCKGYCLNDSQCASGLMCFQRNGFLKVPGCVGAGTKDWNYCVESNHLNGEGNIKGVGGLCEGDCDKDSHCEGDLRCFETNGHNDVPGCQGNLVKNRDYCYDPNQRYRHYEQFGKIGVVLPPYMSERWANGYPKSSSTLLKYDSEYYMSKNNKHVDIMFDLIETRFIETVWFQSWYKSHMRASVCIHADDDVKYSSSGSVKYPSTSNREGWKCVTLQNITSGYNNGRTANFEDPARYVSIHLRDGTSSDDKWGLRQIKIR